MVYLFSIILIICALYGHKKYKKDNSPNKKKIFIAQIVAGIICSLGFISIVVSKFLLPKII